MVLGASFFKNRDREDGPLEAMLLRPERAAVGEHFGLRFPALGHREYRNMICEGATSTHLSGPLKVVVRLWLIMSQHGSWRLGGIVSQVLDESNVVLLGE